MGGCRDALAGDVSGETEIGEQLPGDLGVVPVRRGAHQMHRNALVIDPSTDKSSRSKPIIRS